MSDNLLKQLQAPFPADDIEWRLSRSGTGRSGIWARALAYITARAIQTRLDDVCGVAGWQLTEPKYFSDGKTGSIGVGISINIDGDWITKWDMAELTAGGLGTPFKGGFSGAMKRAGAQWGIGRYLYHLDEAYAVVEMEDPRSKGWNYAKAKDGTIFYWQAPKLPAWALPKEPDHEIGQDELDALKNAWRLKFAADVKNPNELREAFTRFVKTNAGDFPSHDYRTWSREALDRCVDAVNAAGETTGGVSPAVPFDEI